MFTPPQDVSSKNHQRRRETRVCVQDLINELWWRVYKISGDVVVTDSMEGSVQTHRSSSPPPPPSSSSSSSSSSPPESHTADSPPFSGINQSAVRWGSDLQSVCLSSGEECNGNAAGDSCFTHRRLSLSFTLSVLVLFHDGFLSKPCRLDVWGLFLDSVQRTCCFLFFESNCTFPGMRAQQNGCQRKLLLPRLITSHLLCSDCHRTGTNQRLTRSEMNHEIWQRCPGESPKEACVDGARSDDERRRRRRRAAVDQGCKLIWTKASDKWF